ALAFDPDDRYAGAGELGQALRRYLQRRWLVVIGSVFAALFLAALWVAVFRPFDPSTPPAPPDLALVNPQPQPDERPAPRPPVPPDPAPRKPDEPPAGWKVYRSEPGRLRVWLPGIPREKTSTVRSEKGEREMHEAVLSDTETGLFYSVVYADFAGVKFAEVQKRLNDARDGALHNVRGELIKETFLDLGKHPGRDVVVDIPSAKKSLPIIGASTVGLTGSSFGQGPFLAVSLLTPSFSPI